MKELLEWAILPSSFEKCMENTWSTFNRNGFYFSDQLHDFRATFKLLSHFLQFISGLYRMYGNNTNLWVKGTLTQ